MKWQWALHSCLGIDTPVVTVYWSMNHGPTHKKVIYKKAFDALQSMDDLFSYVDIPVRGHTYFIQTKTIVMHPWTSAHIIKDLYIQRKSGGEFHVSMEKMYGR